MRRELLCLALLLGCDTSSPPTPPPPLKPTTAATTAQKPKPTGFTLPTSSATPKQTALVWFAIADKGHPLGTLKVKPGEKGELLVTDGGDKGKALTKDFEPLVKGMALTLGKRTIRVGDQLYPFALRRRLSKRGYQLAELPALKETTTPTSIGTLEIYKKKDKLGLLSFTDEVPALKVTSQSEDAKHLKNRVGKILARESIAFDYHHPDDKGEHQLARVEAKPGDAAYPNAVRLALIFQHRYRVVVVP